MIFNDVEFQLCKTMDELKRGEFKYLPIQCLLDRYLLIKENEGYYVHVVDPKIGDSFEVYKINLYSEDDYELVDKNLSGQLYLEFLRRKIVIEGYELFLVKS